MNQQLICYWKKNSTNGFKFKIFHSDRAKFIEKCDIFEEKNNYFIFKRAEYANFFINISHKCVLYVSDLSEKPYET